MERVVMRFGTDKTVTASEIVEDLDFGNLTPIQVDPTFRAGTNNVSIYDNGKSNRITLTRIEAPEDCPTDSPFILRWEYDASKSETTPSPGFGGFYQSIPGATERTFIQRVIMKVPTDRYAAPAGNSTGAGGSIGFYPGYNGTGTGEWKEYLTQVKYGTGTTSVCGHIYFRGGDNTTSTKFTVDIALVTYYEITNYSGVFSPKKIMSFSEERIMLPQVYEYPAELSGGRNLILNSKGYFSTYATRSFSILPYKFAGAYIHMSFEYEIINGNTGSGLNNRRIGFEFRVNNSDGTYNFYGVWETFPPNEVGITKSGVCSIKHLINVKAISTVSDVIIHPTFIVGEKVVMSNLKIEKGSTPTDWTPAPEDIGLSYPPEITNFTPSFSPNFTLLPEISEGGQN